MATAPPLPPLRLTRDQLGTFLKDFEQIKQFENLFKIVDTIAPDVVNEVSTAATSAQSNATAAMGAVLALAQESATNNAVSEAKALQAMAQIYALQRDYEASISALEARNNALSNQLATLQQEYDSAIAANESRTNQALSLIHKMQSDIEALQMQPAKQPGKRSRFGQFQDTTTQVAGAINTPQAITFNGTDISYGVFLRPGNTEIQVDTEGVYNFQFSIQLDKTTGGVGQFWIWPRLNGVDVPSSASQIRIQGNDAEIVSAANFFFDLKSGDYVQFMFAVDDLSVELKTFPASAFYPAVPSIIVTVSNNIRSYL